MAASSVNPTIRGLVLAAGDRYDYVNFQGKTVSIRKCVIGVDDQRMEKVYNYNAKTHDMMAVGTEILVPSCIREEKYLVVHSGHKVFRCGTKAVHEVDMRAAQELLLEAVHGYVSAAEVRSSPVKRKVSISGIIKSGEREKMGKCRKLNLEDDSGSVTVNMWNEAKNVSIGVGDVVKVKDASVTYDTFNNVNTLSINHSDQVEKVTQVVKDEFEVIGTTDPGDDGMLDVVTRMSGKEVIMSVKAHILLQVTACSSVTDIQNLLPIKLSGVCVDGVLTELRK